MDIFDNPFYVLGASPQDNRRKIAALADEKSFVADAEYIAEARSVLTTPSKRIHAEIRWFPNLDAEEAADIANYCAQLKCGNMAKEPEFPVASSLAILNIKLYAFRHKALADFFQIKYAILEISRLYENLNVETIHAEINRDRAVSGFPEISFASEIEEEMQPYRGEIRKVISSRLLALPQQEYVELITALSEKYSAPNDRYNGHAVIEDIIADYELHTTPEIECQKQQIIEMASHIKKGAKEIRISDAINDLIRMVTAWDALAQPLQLVARGHGQAHDSSEEIAHELRELAVALHNDFGMTTAALSITEALKRSFAELPDFSERIGEDINTLHRLKQEKEDEAQEEQESFKRNRLDKKYSFTVNADKIMVPPFCTCCMKPTSTTETVSTSVSQQSGNRKTTRTISMKMPICQECLEHRSKASKLKWLVVFLSVATAIASVPIASIGLPASEDVFWAIPFAVAVLSYLFFGSVIKLPQLGKNHSTTQQSVWMSGIGMTGNTTTFSFTNWRYAKLFAEANKTSKLYGTENGAPQLVLEVDYRNRAKSRSYLKATDHPVGIGFLVLAFTAAVLIAFGGSLSSFSGSTIPTASTQKPSSTYSIPSSTAKPQTSSKPSSTQTKQQKLNALDEKLSKLEKEIEDMEEKLAALSDEINYYEARYYETYSSTYASQHDDAVEEYNNLWEKYDQAVDDYNNIVGEYNRIANG